MSSFTEPLIVEVDQGGRAAATLVRGFAYYVGDVGSADRIDIPPGFTTDFMSRPWFAGFLFSSFDRSAKADVLHDYLVKNRGSRSKAEIDGIFLEALKVLKVSWLRRTIMYLAVRTKP